MEHVITGYTRLYGLLGYPIQHSKSPRMHNLAFARLGIDGVYLTFDVDSSNLADAIKAMRTLNVRGFNVTMPNKKTVLPYLDQLSEEARLIGSVNTVSCKDGIFVGYNTDGMGFIKNLDDHGVAYSGKTVIQAGAGGAGRAVAVQMALSGVTNLHIYDVDEQAAQDVAQIISEQIPACKAFGYPMDEAAMVRMVSEASLFVNCTPLGMPPQEEQSVIQSFASIPAGVTVVDIIHTPIKSKLLHLAEENGNPIINGIGMMYNQGAIAFHIWTGHEMPLEYIKEKMQLGD